MWKTDDKFNTEQTPKQKCCHFEKKIALSAALKVFLLTTSNAANEKTFIKMPFPFLCSNMRFIVLYVFLSMFIL